MIAMRGNRESSGIASVWSSRLNKGAGDASLSRDGSGHWSPRLPAGGGVTSRRALLTTVSSRYLVVRGTNTVLRTKLGVLLCRTTQYSPSPITELVGLN